MYQTDIPDTAFRKPSALRRFLGDPATAGTAGTRG